MPAPISCTTHQRPIGQGGFYTAQLRIGSGDEFTFVYDCGSVTSKSRLADEIKVLGFKLGNRKLDLLVISHLDADHVNGVDGLLRAVGGVKDVFLPYLSPFERMLCMVNYPTEDEGYYRLLVDPVRSLAQLGAENVYFAGEADNGKDSGDDLDDLDAGRPPDLQDVRGLKLDTYRLIENPSVRDALEGEFAEPAGAHIRCISDKKSMGISAVWKLRIFQKDGLRKTIDQLMADGNFSQPRYGETRKEKACREMLLELEKLLSPTPVTNRAILDKMRTQEGRVLLRTAYSKVSDVHNDVSLCLWHGPGFGFRHRPWTLGAVCYGVPAYSWPGDVTRRYHGWLYYRRRGGTLLTGDISLKGRTLENFLKHYEAELPQTWLIQVPHHGSKNNIEFTSALFDQSRIGFTSAGSANLYNHPHRCVIDKLKSPYKFDVLLSHERADVMFRLDLYPPSKSKH